MKQNCTLLLVIFLLFNYFNSFGQIQEQNSGVNARLTHVHFVDENTGWVTGYDENGESVILKTTDGGENWISQIIDIGFPGGSLFFIDHTTGWIFNGKSIANTNDGGETWTTTEVNSYEDIVDWGFQFVDHHSGWASVSTLNGGHSSIFKTSDGGVTWQTKYDTLSTLFNPFKMNRIHSQSFINADTGWVMFCNQILKTTDGGATWIHQELNLPDPGDTSQDEHFNQILFVNSRVGWLRRLNDVLRTEDGGNTWTSFDFDDPYYYNVLHFTDEQIGMADGDTLFLTKNGGESWEYIFHRDSTRIWDVCMVDTENIWAVGENGLILKIDLSSTTAISEDFKKQSYPGKSMLMQTFPNPFNSFTAISYTLQQAEQVTLKIYNLQEQKVETLVNEFQTIGEHKITWQAEGLPAGLYFAQLQYGTLIESQKLIIQK